MAPDVIEAAKAAIEALGYGPVLLTRLAASRGHDDAVVLRPMPTADAVRHMDGTRRVGYVLQVIVKDTSEAKAMATPTTWPTRWTGPTCPRPPAPTASPARRCTQSRRR